MMEAYFKQDFNNLTVQVLLLLQLRFIAFTTAPTRCHVYFIAKMKISQHFLFFYILSGAPIPNKRNPSFNTIVVARTKARREFKSSSSARIFVWA